jgi:DNA-binding response OmpR family regulator
VKILIVEDEVKIARLLQMELMHEGFTVESAPDGPTALNKAKAGVWDLILLDVMLPGMSGLEVLRIIRKWDAYTPIILLTARNSTADKVTGLNDGANDYVAKPFEIEELTARIRACIRSRSPSTPGERKILSIGPLTMNHAAHMVKRDGMPIELTPKEYELRGTGYSLRVSNT